MLDKLSCNPEWFNKRTLEKALPFQEKTELDEEVLHSGCGFQTG